MRDFDSDIFEQCIGNAKKSVMMHKHGAVLYKNGAVLGQGHNHMSEHMSHAWSCHAEIAAIMSCNKKDRQDLRDATLIVVRVGTDGGAKLSKPCSNCRRFIEKHGIRKVFYSAPVNSYKETPPISIASGATWRRKTENV